MMHYHEDNQYADTKKAEGYAKLITDQNLSVIQELEKTTKYLQEDLKSLTKANIIQKGGHTLANPHQ
jgi:hypothetical protein